MPRHHYRASSVRGNGPLRGRLWFNLPDGRLLRPRRLPAPGTDAASLYERLHEAVELIPDKDRKTGLLIVDYPEDCSPLLDDSGERFQDAVREVIPGGGPEVVSLKVADRRGNCSGGKDETISLRVVTDILRAGPEERLTYAYTLLNTFRRDDADELQATLNEFLVAENPTRYDDKKDVADLVQIALEKRRLYVWYDGRACYIAVTEGVEYPDGRFLLKPVGSSRPLLTRVHLPHLLAEIGGLKLRAMPTLSLSQD